MTLKLLRLALIVALIPTVYVPPANGAATCTTPGTLPPGKGVSWVSSPGCTGAYDTSTQRCHCWGHCGFICEPLPKTPPNPTTKAPHTVTAAPQSCNPENVNGPTLASDETWIPVPNCTLAARPGLVITAGTQRCRCYEYCGYVCAPGP